MDWGVAQWLVTLATLVKVLGSIPTTYVETHNHQ